jgi:hypothetical protein
MLAKAEGGHVILGLCITSLGGGRGPNLCKRNMDDWLTFRGIIAGEVTIGPECSRWG